MPTLTWPSDSRSLWVGSSTQGRHTSSFIWTG